jgi:hypothetical protein
VLNVVKAPKNPTLIKGSNLSPPILYFDRANNIVQPIMLAMNVPSQALGVKDLDNNPIL